MNRKKYLAVLLLSAALFSGCTIGGKEVYFSFTAPQVVFSIGDLSCDKKEAGLYLANYKNIYGHVGKTDLWDGEFDSARLEEGLKMAVINHLSQIYSLALYAEENDITLDENEMAKIDEAAKEYYRSLTDADKEYLGVDVADIRDSYQRYAIAEKVYSQLMNSVDEEVSEDEARIMDAYVLYVKDRATYDTIKPQTADARNFDRLCASWSEGDKGLVSFGRGTYPDEVCDVAFLLEDDEVSDGIETEDGFYFVQCIDKYNEELSEENKKKIVKKRQSDMIEGIRQEQIQSACSQMNVALWDKMHADGRDVTTSSYFEVVDSHLSY